MTPKDIHNWETQCEEIRMEFEKELGIYKWGMHSDPLSKGLGLSADWWLKKINSLLSQKDKEWREKTYQTLEDYTNFLYKHGYTDSDVWAEEPKAVDRFLEELNK